MVQISNSLIIAAAAVVPALAAPVLEAREPLNLIPFTGIKLKEFGHAIDKTTVLPQNAAHHRLVVREPRITKAQPKVVFSPERHLGLGLGPAVRITSNLVPANQRAVPGLVAREPGFFSSLKHDLGGAAHDILKMDAAGLTVASKGLKFVPGVGKGVATAAGIAAKGVNGLANNVHSRDLFEEDDLMAREPRITRAEAKAFAKAAGKVAHHVESGVEIGSVASAFLPQKQQNQQRSLEYLEARASFPKFRLPGSRMRQGGRAAGFLGPSAFGNTGPVQVAQRDFDDFELEAREPKFGFGSIIKDAEGVASNFIRDDEFEAREPHFGFGSIVKDAEGVASNFIRDDELEAREPHFGFGSILHKAEGVASNFIRDDELEAREPHFGFGSIVKDAEGVASNFIRETPEIDELD